MGPPPSTKDWHRNAQRALRIALTTVKSSLSAFRAASESGCLILKDLSDTILLLVSGRYDDDDDIVFRRFQGIVLSISLTILCPVPTAVNGLWIYFITYE